MAQDEKEEEIEDSEDELRQKFIDEMINAGFDKNMAVRALEVIKPDQIDEGKYYLHLVICCCKLGKQFS